MHDDLPLPRRHYYMPKGFYLIVGRNRTIATHHDKLIDAQNEMHKFLQRNPREECYIAEIIPRQYAKLGEWVVL